MATPDAPTFPLRPDNRPALDRFRYRLGAYPDILDAMLRELNASSDLERWTHRAPDDPGIALLESAAVVADILTFYQEHYANEAFLRTATWRESIQELVRLTGYRLAPGTGGRASFAVEVKGTSPVVVPAFFPIKAELEDAADPIDFRTTTEHTAYPHLSKFRLYRKRNTPSGLASGSNHFDLFALDDSKDPEGLQAFDLKKGDKLMLVANPPAWTSTGVSISNQKASQIVKVSKVEHLLGRIKVEIEGSLATAWSGTAKAYRVNRTFRHFGHTAPMKTTYQTGSGSSMVTNQYDTYFDRHVAKPTPHDCYSYNPEYLYTHLPIDVLPLDSEVNDLSVGGKILVELNVNPIDDDDATLRRITLVHTIRSLRSRSMSWSNVNGPSTWIDIGSQPIVNSTHYQDARADIREIRIHEVTSPALSLRRSSYGTPGNFTAANQLYFYGGSEEAEPLIGRRVYFLASDGRFAHGTVMDVDTDGAVYARMRKVTLDKKPKGFKKQDFSEHSPKTDVFGNIVDVTQGKAEASVPLGNGDARLAFQTFKVPKAPVTYLLVPEATPSQVPELTVRVNNREWTRVDSFFGRGPLEEIYIVREDAKGDTYVQFGDGETGARLPSGINNVTAEYRTGIGALGPGKPNTKPSAGAKLDNLDKLTLAGEVSEGSEGEDEGKAKLAAPGKLQSLGRLVSLQDYESETLQIAGVVTAKASWEVLGGVPTVHLCVLLEQAQQSNAQFNAVEAIIRSADEARGPNRHPLQVTQCELRYVYLSVTYAHDPALLVADVDASLRAALGLVDDEASERTGLFGLRRRRLGEKEYLTRIEGTLQNVPGIIWCRVETLGLLPAGNEPAAISMPVWVGKNSQVPCTSTELLQLHTKHLTLTPSTA